MWDLQIVIGSWSTMKAVADRVLVYCVRGDEQAAVNKSESTQLDVLFSPFGSEQSCPCWCLGKAGVLHMGKMLSQLAPTPEGGLWLLPIPAIDQVALSSEGN